MYSINKYNKDGLNRMPIKCNLSTLLGSKRINQRELSRLAGLNPVTVNQIYNDKWKQISRDAIEKICRALNCQVSDLLEYTPE